jgi:hypothetical protein
VCEDVIKLMPGRARMSRQARLTLAMLVLIPTAAVVAGVTAAAQVLAASSRSRGLVLLVFGLGVLLLDVAVAFLATARWLGRRGRHGGVADARGVTVRLGRRTAFLPWSGFDRVSVQTATLLGWLRPDALLAAHPVVARLPRRNADAGGNVPLVLGTLADVYGSLPRLRGWLGQDVEVA